jgi:tetratricopeptide (TPR) repeat protein
MFPTIAKVTLVLALAGFSVQTAQAACTGPPALEAKLRARPDAQSYADLGSWFNSHNQYACAAESFRGAVRAAPQSAELNYLLGFNLCSSGNEKDAIEPLQHSIEIDPAALKTRLILATALDHLQRRSEARVQWEGALAIDPKSTIALDGLSKSMVASGDFASAIRLLRAAPSNEQLAVDLAYAYGRAGMLSQAAETLTGALRAAPSSLRISNALATVYANQQRFQDATDLLKETLRIHPEDEEAQRVYLRVLVLTGNGDDARPLAANLLARDPDNSDALNLNGILEFRAQDFDAARKHLEGAVASNPNDSSSRYYLGLTLAHLEDAQGAREQFEKAVLLDPTSAEAHFQLGTVLRNLGEAQRAREQFALSQQMSDVKARRAMVNAKASEAAQKLESGEVEQAIALYREALEAAAESAQLNYQLAVALDRGGDTANERTALEQAVRIDPNLSAAQNQLGLLLARGGDAKSAEEHLRQAVQSAPDYTQAWINLAATLGAETRYAEAQEAIAKALQLDPGNASAVRLKGMLTEAQSHP